MTMKLTIKQTNSPLTKRDFTYLDTLFAASFSKATKHNVTHATYTGVLYALDNNSKAVRTVAYALFLQHKTTKKIKVFTVEKFEFEEQYALFKTTYKDAKFDKQTRTHVELRPISAELAAFIKAVESHLEKNQDE